jgi:hypothetical protein
MNDTCKKSGFPLAGFIIFPSKQLLADLFRSGLFRPAKGKGPGAAISK